jgi:hypothetical protein
LRPVSKAPKPHWMCLPWLPTSQSSILLISLTLGQAKSA